MNVLEIFNLVVFVEAIIASVLISSIKFLPVCIFSFALAIVLRKKKKL